MPSTTTDLNNHSNKNMYYNLSNFKLTWKNLSVWLEKQNQSSYFSCFNQNEYIKVLNNVNGVVYSGSLTAIIGISGSGKTTLLTAISRRTKGIVVGDLLFNNTKISQDEMKNISSFLPQKELITLPLTLSEHLQLMARLKLHETTSDLKRNKIIFKILNQLGLSNQIETKLSFLSGGELKKLSIAEQLLTDPLLLFCDEPTTGLDSFNAENIINILRDIANNQKAVICSIHQPTYRILQNFDQVSILVKGSMVYYGSTENLIRFFEYLGVVCPNSYNPIEFFVSCIGKKQNDAIYIQKMSDTFQKSDFSKNLKRELNAFNNNSTLISYFNHENSDLNKRKHKFHIQLFWLLWRNNKTIKRNNKNIVLRFILYMFIASLLSIMFWNITNDLNQKDIQNLEGLIFLAVTETIFTFTYSVLHTFPAEMPKLLREISDGLYDPAPFYLSKVISQVPIIIVETFFYSLLIFWCTGLSGSFPGFISFYSSILCCALSSSAYGFTLSTSFDSVATASLISVPLEFLCMTYSGIYLNISNLSWFTSWLPYISQFYYGTESISIVQWKTITNIVCENPNLPCIKTGKNVLLKYGFHEERFYFDLFMLFFCCIIFHFIGFCSFNKKCKKSASY